MRFDNIISDKIYGKQNDIFYDVAFATSFSPLIIPVWKKVWRE